MVFSEFIYKRPDMKKLRARANRTIFRMRNARSYDSFKRALFAFLAVYREIATSRTLVEIRHAIDTRDRFYDEENEFFNEAIPEITPVFIRYYEALLKSRFAKELELEFGGQILKIAELKIKRFDKKLVPLMIRENRLSSEYEKLLASCEIELLGERRNLMGIAKLLQSDNRTVRRQAYDAYASFFEANEERFDELYDKLVHVRDEMGKKMGFQNFVPLAYMNLGRTDYGPADVARFREQVQTELVPLCTRLREEQARRIGVPKLKFYDEAVQYPDGNAVPAGDRAYLEAQALAMYDELSPETGEFFRFMCEHELMSLETRPAKANGGFCTFLPDYSAPFIFSNFNGTSGDVDVLTHEAGHAFQAFRSCRAQALPEYWESTYEVCEIHSMSMEYFAYPWMERFFGEGAGKYKTRHLLDAITFVPYGVCVDEFQHRVYEAPDLTPAERRALWRSLEKKYLPHRDYDGKTIFTSGAFFFKQLHIFMDPFYYIDYTLASMGAFECYGKMKRDRASAWSDYLRLCDLGGSRPYLELLAAANLKNPFAPGSVKAALGPLLEDLGQP